jgi:hypothetical protein
MAARCSYDVAALPRLWGGFQATENTTRSSPRVSRAAVAMRVWPRWGGSNVPPRIPTRLPPQIADSEVIAAPDGSSPAPAA